MKKTLLLFFFFYTLSSQCQQEALVIQKLLTKELKNLAEHQHGNHYMLNDKMASEIIVKQNLQYIKYISHLNLKNYKSETIEEGRHTVKIFKSSSKNSDVEKLVEIKSVYTTFDKKYKAVYFNYYMILTKNPKIIQISFDENGISGYQWDNKDFYVSREMRMFIEDEIEEIDTKEKKTITTQANEAFHAFRLQIKDLKTKYFK